MTFSIKTLLAVSAYLAIALAGWFVKSQVWGELFVLITFLVLLVTTIACLFGPAERRAKWGSFTLAAALYLAITVYPGNFTGFPTSSLLDTLNKWADPVRLKIWGGTTIDYGGPNGLWLSPRTIQAGVMPMGGMGGGMGGMGMGGMGGFPTGWSPPTVGVFHWSRYNTTAKNVGHCLFAMILGFAAVAVAQRVVVASEGVAAPSAVRLAVDPHQLRQRARYWLTLGQVRPTIIKRAGLVVMAAGGIALVAVSSYAGNEMQPVMLLPHAAAVSIFVVGCGLILVAERKKRTIMPDAKVSDAWSGE